MDLQSELLKEVNKAAAERRRTSAVGTSGQAPSALQGSKPANMMGAAAAPQDATHANAANGRPAAMAAAPTAPAGGQRNPRYLEHEHAWHGGRKDCTTISQDEINYARFGHGSITNFTSKTSFRSSKSVLCDAAKVYRDMWFQCSNELCCPLGGKHSIVAPGPQPLFLCGEGSGLEEATRGEFRCVRVVPDDPDHDFVTAQRTAYNNAIHCLTSNQKKLATVRPQRACLFSTMPSNFDRILRVL